MTTRFLRGLICMIAVAIMASTASHAIPIQSMKVKFDKTTFTKISSGTSWAYPTDYSLYYYGQYVTCTLPFNFSYDDQTFNTVWFWGGNGIQFYSASGLGSTWYYAYPYQTYWTYGRNEVWAHYGYSYGYYYTNGNHQSRFDVQGTAPNRVAIFQCTDWVWIFQTGCDMNWQIKLYETSNKIEIIYGRYAGTSTYWSNGTSYYHHGPAFVGKSTSYTNYNDNYISVYPPGSLAGNADWFVQYVPTTASPQGYFGPNRAYQRQVDMDKLAANEGMRVTLKKADPEIINTWPTKGDILRNGQIYGGAADTAHSPAVMFTRISTGPTVQFKYRIYGPTFDINTIYRATDGTPTGYVVTPTPQIGGATDEQLNRYNFTVGQGVCFGTGGTLDLQTHVNDNSYDPGEYYTEASIIVTGIGETAFTPQLFNIAFNQDLAVSSIFKPKPNTTMKYPNGYPVPIQIIVGNYGLNPCSRFDLYVKIYGPTGALVWVDTVYWNLDGSLTPLASTSSTNVDCGLFNPPSMGDYKLYAEVRMVGVTDQKASNNFLPQTGQPDYIFTVSKEIDLRAVSIVRPIPASQIFVGRPIQPAAKYTNKGTLDLAEDTVFCNITEIATGSIIYRDTVINAVITQGARYDTTLVLFKKFFVPQNIGSYTINSYIKSRRDDNPSYMKTVSANFDVVSGLTGTYTIGTSASGAKNFTTIIDAVNALYLRGVSGNVVFELTDRDYSVGDSNNLVNPALDLSAYISGMAGDATVTFKPNAERSYERGGLNTGITINLNTGSGIGIMMGQNPTPANINAIILTATPSQQARYSKSAGYFIFDGGVNKSIRLKVNKRFGSYMSTAFYGKAGVSNNTVQNCVIENSLFANELPHIIMPHSRYSKPLFEYQGEKDYPTTSISAGFLFRSTPPKDVNNSNPNNLDTLPCVNNIIQNCEISNFGYGIVSLGAGVLRQTSADSLVKYYNGNNNFSYNTIHDIARAGVYVGFEKNTKIERNRIYSVNGLSGNTHASAPKDAAGIMVGGDYVAGPPAWYGYNCIGIRINGNEISGVNSPYAMYGIKVTQNFNQYDLKTFPDEIEETVVSNNIIWNLGDNNTSAVKAGIYVGTERSGTNIYNARTATYFTTNDKIISNTVILEEDNGSTTGAIAGVAIQNSYNPVLTNNAIAVLDQTISNTCPVSALVYYEGIFPGTTGGLVSDRNAYYRIPRTDNSGPALYGFFELDANGNNVEPLVSASYDQNGYETMRQWRNWTSQDQHSIESNWTSFMETKGVSPYNFRMKTPVPKGAVMNNRGVRLNDMFGYNYGFEKDIDGNNRGLAGQQYDIGACEFDCPMYTQDIEFRNVPEPASYQSGSGTFSDAEYVMTELPCKLRAIVRNSGTIFQSGCKVRIEVYRANWADNDDPTTFTLVHRDTIVTDIVAANDLEVAFTIPTKVIKTFAELNADPAVNPKYFPGRLGNAIWDSTMNANVTPRYRFDVIIGADENNSNNLGSVMTRYYIKKSNTMHTLITGQSTNINIRAAAATPTQNVIAGRLNFDEVVNAFKSLGYYALISKDVFFGGTRPDSLKIDCFDRGAWEPKAVNYSMYKYMYWTDAHDGDSITRYQRFDLTDYLNSGVANNKKNLVISSQEMLRSLDNGTNPEAAKFAKEQLRSINVAPGISFGGNSAHGETCTGIAMGRNIIEPVRRTGFVKGAVTDADPYCAMVRAYTGSEGLSRGAYSFNQNLAKTRSTIDSLLGIASTGMNSNVITLGVDWRHWQRAESIIRSAMDFIEKNGGTIFPVELVNFQAELRNNAVELNWLTASELNSDKFEVERSVKGGMFSKIAEVKAAGKSNTETQYGPVVDRSVEVGNTYVYRLKMIDANGDFKYSEEREIEVSAELSVGVATPNPADVRVTFAGKVATGAEITFFDMNGRKVALNSSISSKGIEVELGNAVSGSYTMIVRMGETTLTRQFTVVR